MRQCLRCCPISWLHLKSYRERIIFITHCLKQWAIIDDIKVIPLMFSSLNSWTQNSNMCLSRKPRTPKALQRRSSLHLKRSMQI
jgi:hypothetical protein